jgi:hypothetical protein
VATTILDDGIGDEDYGIITCEYCGRTIKGGQCRMDEFGYDHLCERCYGEMVDDVKRFGG